MPGNELGHFEHSNLALTAKERLQFSVGNDIPFVLGILEIVLLDIFPYLLHHLPSRQRTLADNRLKIGREIVRLQ